MSVCLDPQPIALPLRPRCLVTNRNPGRGPHDRERVVFGSWHIPDAIGANANDLGDLADEEPYEVCDVDADIHHRAAAALVGLVHPFGPELCEANVTTECAYVIDGADGAFINDPFEKLHAWVVAMIEAYGELHPGLARAVDHPPARCHVS